MKTFIKKLSVVALISGFFCPGTHGKISLPEIFSDHMVLQQKADVLFWGWASTGETVRIQAGWMDREVSVKVGNQGIWEVIIATPPAGGPYQIRLKGHNEILLEDVMIGEVWLCSGQSNMEWSARSGINNGEEEVKNADYPGIRLFTVYHGTSQYPQDHLTGEWDPCTPETMRSFSAVGYLFARILHRELGVPVGIINASWGGTPAEAWMPEEIITRDGFLLEAAKKQKPVPWGPVEPGRIYNSMISPLVPFHISGVIWYQGESNTINAYAYKEILSGLITSWRSRWGYDFPFYYAQIAPYRYEKPYEGVEVRDAQRRALEVPNTGMIVLSDIGDTTDIHPKNKQDVALRFANITLNRHYESKRIEDSGPLYRNMMIDRNRAVISFDHSEGLHVKGKSLTCFEIAGEDKVFYPAEAKIEGEQVSVSSRKVKSPVSVRFAWTNTATPNLFNGANLPASCFIANEE
jgi:sialate O-acetylesterase